MPRRTFGLGDLARRVLSRRTMPIPMPAPPMQEAPKPARDQEITSWRIRLYYWSRNPHVLFWIAVVVIGASIAVAHTWQAKDGAAILKALTERFSRHRESGESKLHRVELAPELLKPKPDIDCVLTALRQRDPSDESASATV